jgi:hypothetical protein
MTQLLPDDLLINELGLGIQILYNGDKSRQLDGLWLVPSRRMTEPDAAVEEDNISTLAHPARRDSQHIMTPEGCEEDWRWW